MISRTVKGRILYSLSMFVMLFVLLAGIAIQWLKESETFRLTDEKVEKIDLNTLDLLRTDVDFYAFDLTNPEFFTRGVTPILNRHDSMYQATRELITQVKNVEKFDLDAHLTEADTLLVRYNKLFRQLVSRLQEKGFKDHGLEGKLRTFAHELENKKLIPATEMLMLRRHEKDYLLRDDQEYAKRLNTLSAELITRFASSPGTVKLLTDYTKAFNDLVALNDAIGLRTHINLKGELNAITVTLHRSLDALNAEAETLTAQNHQKTSTMFIVATAFAVVFCGVLIYLTARAV